MEEYRKKFAKGLMRVCDKISNACVVIVILCVLFFLILLFSGVGAYAIPFLILAILIYPFSRMGYALGMILDELYSLKAEIADLKSRLPKPEITEENQ